MKLAFVTDSGTGYSAEYWKKKGIFSVPLQITAGTETYDENETISKLDVIEGMKKQIPYKTSLPSLGKIEDLFEEIKSQGYDGVFAVPICKGLSGTLDAMESAAAQIGLSFYGFDTACTAVLQCHCIETAKAMYEEGKSIEEIMEKLEAIAGSADTILLVDDLQHMKRGGRLTPMAAALGGLLKIKPILQINKGTNGKVDVMDKVRTMSKAQDKVIERMKNNGVTDQYDFTVAHVNARDAAEGYAKKISQSFNNARVRIIDLVSTVGIHTGLGCLALQVFNPEGKPVTVYEEAETVGA